jgi:hypothetical protein
MNGPVLVEPEKGRIVAQECRAGHEFKRCVGLLFVCGGILQL